MEIKRDDRLGDPIPERGLGDSGKTFQPGRTREKESPPIPRAKSKSRPIGRPLAASEYEKLKKAADSASSRTERNSAQEDPSVKESTE